ncbi:pyocin knob domain-containing protein [uncultured Duncaniella sp.]|uniref:pyocin knob domain-containing protein n=1 Tax=uncultured Duncaniella sp. TaxID=2768039 RepID=UPI00272B1404|nr:pyocin knob domain-containing protein [uncultured Duncaniella sp.]
MNDRTMLMTESILLSHLPNVLTKRGTVAAGSNLNTVTQPGCYLIANSDIENLPPGMPKYATLAVLPGYYLMHMIVPTQSPCLFIRLRTNEEKDTWTKWIKFSGEYL